MASSSPATVLNLTLDLNSQAHAPAAGVLKILDLVARAPHDFDLHLRVIYGASVLRFLCVGLEESPCTNPRERSDLEGSIVTPEVYNTVEAEVNKEVVHFSEGEDADSIASDKPIPKKRRRKALHHAAIGDEPFEETESEDDGAKRGKTRRKLRTKRPAPGSMAEPPQDLHDVLESDDDHPRGRCVTQSKVANTLRRHQKKATGSKVRTERQFRTVTMPDLYMDVSFDDQLNEILARRESSSTRLQRKASSKPPKEDSYPTQ